MSNNHVLTKEIGNLRGFSTDNIFVRPPNVADISVNLQRAPDASTQIRRGYQCEIGAIGGLGTGTFDDPDTDQIHTATIGFDGQLYNKEDHKLFFYYDGQITGEITNITNANPANVTSPSHGLQTGAILLFKNVDGMTSINNQVFTITVTGPNNFTVNGFDSTLLPAYISGGDWIIAFTQYRYLVFTIFTDPRYIIPGNLQSITCNLTVNKAAIIFGNQTAVNTINIQFGHELAIGNTIQFYDVNRVFQQRVVTGTTAFTVTFGGTPVSVANNIYINKFYDIPFGKGFDVLSPYLISSFISVLTDPTTGVFGLNIAANGDTDYPAAFIEIIEPLIIDNIFEIRIDYYYWKVVNHTVNIPFLKFSTVDVQDSPEFENASFACYHDVLYIADGYDYPQKYDGQTVYRVGMPEGQRVFDVHEVVAPIEPFSAGETYTYAITYEQIDNRGHLVEGVMSDTRTYTVLTTKRAIQVTFNNLLAGTGWNTNSAISSGPSSLFYGPDSNGFYYFNQPVNAGFTLRIGDTAFYQDDAVATITGSNTNTNNLNVAAGHNLEVGDFVDIVTDSNVLIQRFVTEVSPTSIIIDGGLITVTGPVNIMAKKTSLVFGDIAISDGLQLDVNVINVLAGQSIALGDIVSFVDAIGDLQRRTVTAVTATTITISGIPVIINDLTLITSENQRTDAINLQRKNFGSPSIAVNNPISNNLRVNIYRTLEGGNQFYLLTTLPNNSFVATSDFVDEVVGLATDNSELGLAYRIPLIPPDPPPISKYLLVYGNQLLYGGGEVNNAENNDNVYFSEGNNPEYVSAAQNAIAVPSVDDSITGMGVSGTTLVITKNQSIWSVTGDLLSGQWEVSQVAAGSNIGCAAFATLKSVGSLLYFMHTNGVYAMTENQLFPTDAYGNPIPLSVPIDRIFRETNYSPQRKFVFKRAVACNYTKDNQYLLFLPCEDIQSTIRTANANSIVLCYDYQGKNWYQWDNINAAGGMYVIRDYLYFQERRFSGINGNVANLYKQHRFYRLVDHADHAGPQRVEWRSSWTDLGEPLVRKKFTHCVLLMDRISDLFQFNFPDLNFSSYVDRIPNLQSTIARVTTVDNVRNSSWSNSPWGWNYWAGYQDSFVRINLKGGTVAKSMQVGFTLTGINMDIRFSGFQLEAVPENRRTIAR